MTMVYGGAEPAPNSGGGVPDGSGFDGPPGPIGDGDPPGPVSKALGRRFHRITRGEDPAFDHWLAYVNASADRERGEVREREGNSGQGKE